MRFVVASFAFALASCGPNLGSHAFVSARYASELPADYGHSRNDPGYVVVTFRTDADLNSADINALYAMVDPCGASDSGRMTAFGPFTDSTVPKELPLPGDREVVKRYRVYVPVTGELWGDRANGKTPVAGIFDLRTNRSEICFRLEHTGYPWATRTNPVRVAPSILSRAIDLAGA